MDNPNNLEKINVEESAEREITIKPETDIISGKMRFNLSNITGKEKEIILDLGESKDKITVDVEYFDDDLSGYFEIEHKEEEEDSVTLINKEGEIIFKRTGDIGKYIKVTGKPNVDLNIELEKTDNKPSKIIIDEKDLNLE